MTAPLVNKLSSFSAEARNRRRAGRRRAYILRSVARALLPHERVSWCGRRVVMADVAIRVKEGHARWSGLQTCASVWQCPACSQLIAAERAEELRTMGERHTKAGGTLYMAAFTFSHKKWHTLLPREGERAHPDFVGPMPAMNGLRDDVTLMWSKMIAGRRWQAMKAAAGVVGIVRALEVTHGKNGWHPHIHALFALDHADDARAAAFGVELFERWDATVQRHGYAACNPAVWRWEKAANYDAAADYVVKGAFDLELTRGHMKLAKGGGRSPWQLLEDAGAGDRRAARLFQEFARAFKGARQVTWSYGLKARYGIDEREDGEITAAEAGEVIGRIPARIYSRIAFKGNCAAVLEAAEDQGWPGVVHLLKGWGLYWVGPPDHFLAGMKGNPRGGRHGQYWAA